MVPDYETLMLPLLELLADGRDRTARDCMDQLASRFELSEDDLGERIVSGGNLFASRLHWANTYLFKAGLLERPRRGVLRLSQRGYELLRESHERLSTAFLESRYEEMRSWRRARRGRSDETGVGGASTIPTGALSPEEELTASYDQISRAVRSDLLDRAMRMPPERFEQLVVDLLLALGYGGPSGVGVRLGRAGDGGVDGLIQQDKLGFERIYLQAKRWQGSVGPSVIREFASSLRLRGASKGVIITTSTFTDVAVAEAERLGVVLVHGETLAELMFDVGLGVSVASTFVVKRVDVGYFEPED